MYRIPLKTISIFFAFVLPAFAQNPTSLLFNDLNAAARESYAASRALALKSDQPVFLVTDTVTLIRGEDLGSLPYTPALYHELKSISHLPLYSDRKSNLTLLNPCLRRLLYQVVVLLLQLGKISQNELFTIPTQLPIYSSNLIHLHLIQRSRN